MNINIFLLSIIVKGMTKFKATFDTKPWYEEINDVIDKRHRQCTLKGESFYYDPPTDVFKEYKSGAEFETRVPYNMRKDCVRPTSMLSEEKDKYNRYFKHAQNKYACKALRGTWDQNTINRNNRFGRGTCWASENDAHCARKHEVPQLVRRLPNIPNKDLLIKKGKKDCDADEKCAWFKAKGEAFDCVRKNAITNEGNMVMDPPSSMPKDITSKDANIEQYLYDWYVRKNHGIPPSTTELFGEGDRCNPPKPGSAPSTGTATATPNSKKSRNATPDVDIPMDIDVMKLDVDNKNDEKVLRSVMKVVGYHGIEAKIMEWKRRKAHLRHYPEHKYKDEPLENLARDWSSLMADEAKNDDDDPVEGFKPSIPQSVVNMVMKNIAKKDSSNRGLMAIHSTGSGKTCCAAGVMDAFWDSKKQILFVSSIDAISSNPDYKFHECAKNLFPRFKQDAFKGASHEESMQKIADAFEKRNILFLPFAKLANRIVKTEKFKQLLFGSTPKQSMDKPVRKSKKETVPKDKPTKNSKSKIIKIKGGAASTQLPRLMKDSSMSRLLEYACDLYQQEPLKVYNALKTAGIHGWDDFVDLDNACLIVDEVHNLFRPLATQREKHKLVEEHIVNPQRHPSMKVVIMTATPGDSVNDIIKLINIVRDPSHDAIKPPNVEDATDVRRFKKDIRGLISFFDMSNDTTKFPIVTDNGLMKYPMSTKQFSKYVEAYKDVKADYKNYDALAKKNQLAKYWSGARKYSNMLFNFEKGLKLTEFSSKLPALLDTITKFQAEKHYVYSTFYEARGTSQGILEIARQLDALGYKKMTVKEARSYYKKISMPSSNDGAKAKKAETREVISSMPPKAKRYVLAIQKEIGEEGSTTAGKNLGFLIDLYNHPENRNGDFIGVFLASQGFNEGIDLKGVRHIHFFEPLVTLASDLQTIGRARRYCSHAALERDKGEWSVQIHRYLSDLPIEYTVKGKGDPQDAEKRTATLEKEIADAKAIQESFKGMKAPAIQEKFGIADYRTVIKEQISEKNKELKELKKNNKIDSSSIQNVDEFIYEQALEKMKELLIVQQAVKEAAVDCRILASFHNKNSTNPIVCDKWIE